MKSVILMYHPRFFSPFVERVSAALGSRTIFWIQKFPRCSPVVDAFDNFSIQQLDEFFKNDQAQVVRVYIFDIHLMPVIAALRYIRKIGASKGVVVQFFFIQHGAFADLSTTRRRSFSLSWIGNSLKSFVMLLRTSSFKNILILVELAFKSFWLGSFAVKSQLSEFIPDIRYGLFWNEEDVHVLGPDVLRRIQEVQVCEPPDREIFKLSYEKNGSVVYVAQPLVEDGLLHRNLMDNFLVRLNEERPGLLVLLHPRSDLSIYSIFKSDQLVRARDITHLQISLAIGHFSSLLLSLHPSIPVEQEGFAVPLIKDSAEYIRRSRERMLDGNMRRSFSAALIDLKNLT